MERQEQAIAYLQLGYWALFTDAQEALQQEQLWHMGMIEELQEILHKWDPGLSW